jgi:hypothetical protein
MMITTVEVGNDGESTIKIEPGETEELHLKIAGDQATAESADDMLELTGES